MRGAGGTEGGMGQFLIGLAMMIGGGYLFLSSVHVGYSWGGSLYRFGGFNLTGGTIMIPFVFGVAIMFYDSKKFIGWLLTFGSLLALTFGILRSLRFHFTSMTSMDLIIILVLLFGGIGLFLSSLRNFSDRADRAAQSSQAG